MCSNIFDMACIAWSPTSTAWKIVGHLALPFLWCEDEEEFFEPMHVGIDDLCQLTGFRTDTIFQTSVENLGFFDVAAFYWEKEYHLSVSIIPGLRSFLMTESRSHGLHFAYRNFIIHELSSKISYSLNVSQSFVTFSTLFIIGILKQTVLCYRFHSIHNVLCAFFQRFEAWNIQVDMSDMGNIVDLIHPFIQDTEFHWYKNNGLYPAIDIFQWFLKQLHVSPCT